MSPNEYEEKSAKPPSCLVSSYTQHVVFLSCDWEMDEHSGVIVCSYFKLRPVRELKERLAEHFGHQTQKQTAIGVTC